MSATFFMDVHVPRAVTVALRFRSVDVLTPKKTSRPSWMTTRYCSGPPSSAVFWFRRIRIFCARTTLQPAFLRDCLRAPAADFGRMVEDLELIAQATRLEEWAGRIEYLSVE